MKNAKVTIDTNGIMTIVIDLKKGLGESASGKSFLVARSDGRMENFDTPNGVHYIAMTVGKYKNEPGQKQQKVEPELVDMGWGANKQQAQRQAVKEQAPVTPEGKGIAPGQTVHVAGVPMRRR